MGFLRCFSPGGTGLMGFGEENHRDGVTVSAHGGEGAHCHRVGHLAKAVSVRSLLPTMLFPRLSRLCSLGGSPCAQPALRAGQPCSCSWKAELPHSECTVYTSVTVDTWILILCFG